MRCSCQICDTYMVHSEGLELGCVCPECGYRCKACLGTNSVISRDALKEIRRDPAMLQSIFSRMEESEADEPQPLQSDEDPSRWDG